MARRGEEPAKRPVTVNAGPPCWQDKQQEYAAISFLLSIGKPFHGKGSGKTEQGRAVQVWGKTTAEAAAVSCLPGLGA